jgi:hypothetical protein
MCLLHTSHPDTVLTRADIVDYYSHNSDGVGVMYSEMGEDGRKHLVVKKALPKTPEEAWQFYLNNIKGREALVHWRWATHGHVNLDNCHPYPIVPDTEERPLYMMHNGILQIGNAEDPAKSDTWHFIREYLGPLFDPLRGGDVSLAFREPFIKMLTKFAGYSNKLAFMDNEGNIALTDREGWHEENGILYSNTYAWSPKGFRKGYYSGEWDDERWNNHRYNQPTTATKGVSTYPKPDALGNVVQIGAKNSVVKSTGGVVYSPATAMTKAEKATLDEYQDSYEDMFEALDAARRKLSYREIDYIDMVRFTQRESLSALWHLVTLCETRALLQKDFIKYVKYPTLFKEWADQTTRDKIEEMDRHVQDDAAAMLALNEQLKEALRTDEDPEVFDVEDLIDDDEPSTHVPGEVAHYRMIDGMWHRRVGEASWLPAPDYSPVSGSTQVWSEADQKQEVSEAERDWAQSLFVSTDRGVIPAEKEQQNV